MIPTRVDKATFFKRSGQDIRRIAYSFLYTPGIQFIMNEDEECGMNSTHQDDQQLVSVGWMERNSKVFVYEFCDYIWTPATATRQMSASVTEGEKNSSSQSPSIFSTPSFQSCGPTPNSFKTEVKSDPILNVEGEDNLISNTFSEPKEEKSIGKMKISKNVLPDKKQSSNELPALKDDNSVKNEAEAHSQGAAESTKSNLTKEKHIETCFQKELLRPCKLPHIWCAI